MGLIEIAFTEQMKYWSEIIDLKTLEYKDERDGLWKPAMTISVIPSIS